MLVVYVRVCLCINLSCMNLSGLSERRGKCLCVNLLGPEARQGKSLSVCVCISKLNARRQKATRLPSQQQV